MNIEHVLEWTLYEDFIAVRRPHDHSNSYKGKHFIGPGLPFKALVYYHHGGMLADRMLKRLLNFQMCGSRKRK